MLKFIIAYINIDHFYDTYIIVVYFYDLPSVSTTSIMYDHDVFDLKWL